MIFKEVSGKPDDDGVVQLNNQILQKVYKYMAGMHMIEKKSHVIAGISGGADSMCLLFVLLSIQKTMELELTAVHINHGLRGAEADEDQAFVQHFCARHHVECICFKTDIRAYAKKERMTEEEAGRKYRYACFEKVRVQKDADVIAVAHHRDDLAETVLWNLVRGTGLKGMAGILPLREYIIRPLLILQRAEIEALLTAYNIDYRTDCTNLEAAYTRNRLRLHVMPYLTEHINRQASAHLAQAAETFGEVWHYIERQTLQAWKDAADEEGRIDVVRFAEEDIVIQKELIRMLIQKKSGRLKDITQRHIEAVRGLASKPAGRCVSLPYGLTAIREGVYLAIEKNEDQVQKAQQQKYLSEETMDFIVPGEYQIEQYFGKYMLSAEKTEQIPVFLKNPCTKCFDYGRINDGLLLRHRRSGDYMQIDRQGNTKPLRRILIDAKVPEHVRDSLWLLADGAHILWIPGAADGRISEYYKVSQNTKHVLMIKIKGEEKNGR